MILHTIIYSWFWCKIVVLDGVESFPGFLFFLAVFSFFSFPIKKMGPATQNTTLKAVLDTIFNQNIMAENCFNSPYHCHTTCFGEKYQFWMELKVCL